MFATVTYCGALGFKDENKGTLVKPHFGQMCCNQGKVFVQVAKNFELHKTLVDLLTSNSLEAQHVCKHLQMFNVGMAFTSAVMDLRSRYQGRNNNRYSALKISGQLV